MENKLNYLSEKIDECGRGNGAYEELELPKSLPEPPIYQLLKTFEKWSEENKVTITNVSLFVRSWREEQGAYEETVRLMKQTL